MLISGRLFLCASLLVAAPTVLAAQGAPPAGDSGLVLLIEHRFTDSLEKVAATLESEVVYRVEVMGPGTPVFQDRSGRSAFVLSDSQWTKGQPRWFTVYPYQFGAHMLRVTDLPSGDTATVRLYRDVPKTRHVSAMNHHDFDPGVMLGAGAHSGYQLDTTGKGGSDWEACLVVMILDRFGVAAGFAEQSLSIAPFSVHWTFVEGQVRILGAHLIGRVRTDLAALLRYSEAEGIGTSNANPNLTSYGLYLTQHLSAGNRGWSLYGSWQHGRLGHTTQSQKLDTNRFAGGIQWLW